MGRGWGLGSGPSSSDLGPSPAHSGLSLPSQKQGCGELGSHPCTCQTFSPSQVNQ